MKEILSDLKLEIKELSERFGVSRPTLYRYIDIYEGNKEGSIPEKIKAFFDYLSSSEISEDSARLYLIENFPNDQDSSRSEVDAALENIITKFCDDGQKKSNFLSVILPTGARKTSSVVKFIADYVASGGERNIFFITTLKKNLPVNEDPAEDRLREAFKQAEIEGQYEEKVMMVDSLSNMLRFNFPKLSPLEKKIIAGRFGSAIVGELERRIRDLDQLTEGSAAYEDQSEKFREREKDFRDSIRRALKYEEKDPDKRKAMAIASREWSWVSKIYPTVFTSDRQVFLMSMDKFVSAHDTIVEGRYSMYNSELTQGAYIFIDEFDATKETVLDNIIESDKREVDYLGLFRRIFRTLEHNDDIWTEYYRLAGKDGSLYNEVKEFYEIVKETVEENHLEVDFKMEHPETMTFIFRDSRLISTGKGKRYRVFYDSEQRINLIRTFDKENDTPSEGRSVESLVGLMYVQIRHFEGLMFRLAMNYYQRKHDEGDEISQESAIRTMLDPYDFNDKQKDALVKSIRFRPPAIKKKNDISPEVSFYNVGFEYFSFIDSEEHDLSTKIYRTRMNRTPEKMLMLTLSGQETKVIGISATARLPTVVGNYDFRYLSSQEGFSEYHLVEDDRELLREMFTRTADHYDRVKIETELIDGSISPRDLFSDGKFASDLTGWLGTFDDKKSFYRRRYLRIFDVYRRFVRTEDVRSMLCFMNVFPKSEKEEGGDLFSQEKMEMVFKTIVKEYCKDLESSGRKVPEYINALKDRPFEVIRSGNFDKSKEELLKRLAKGEKIFVMTSYSTVGAGQNLQYQIPSDVAADVRAVSSLADPKRSKMKDFDAIYLDMPTNIVPQVKEQDKSTLIKAIFASESLQENHEIDRKMAKGRIEDSFREYYGLPKLNFDGPELTRESFRVAYARRVIQALGRICRTFMKNKVIHIYADDALGKVFKGKRFSDFVDPEDPLKGIEDAMANEEFKALFKKLQESSCPVFYEEKKELLDNESVKAMQYIDSAALSGRWSEHSMKTWTGVRDFVLRFPTVPADSKIELVYDMYTRLKAPGKSLSYVQENDYHSVLICEDGIAEVSEEDARLKDLLKIPAVRPLFGPPASLEYDVMPPYEELKSIPLAESFAENTAIMCPALYHNIYKGALGEIVGKAVFSEWGVLLLEITDPAKFEKFDFVTDNGMYIDFKHWYGPGGLDNEVLIRKTLHKLKKIGGSRAAIVNILKPEDYKGKDFGSPLDGSEFSYTTDDGTFYDFSGLVLVTVPYLYDCNGEVAADNPEKYRIIEEVTK